MDARSLLLGLDRDARLEPTIVVRRAEEMWQRWGQDLLWCVAIVRINAARRVYLYERRSCRREAPVSGIWS